MISSRALATGVVLAVAGGVAALGVTWAAESPTPPQLERTSSAVLFDDVRLVPDVPVERCAGIVPRGAGLVGIGFDGAASGSLRDATRIHVERGSGAVDGAGRCVGFVPVATVYDGTLADLPAPGTGSDAAVAIDADQPVAYRATLTLPSPAAGATRFDLRVIGRFADPPAPVPPPAPRPPDPSPPAAAPCRQLQSTGRVTRVSPGGALRVTVRTPRTLPVQLVRPLPVYVTTRGVRPRIAAGDHRVPLRRTPGGRWVGFVPASALRRMPRVTVTAGRATVTVPLRTRPCAPRVRTFLRAGRTVDLRVDSRLPLAGLAVRIPAVLGRPARGRVHVGAVDLRGVPRATRGPVSARGRAATSRLPRVTITGRRIEVLDLPPGTRTLSLRLVVPGADAARPTACQRDHPTVGDVTVEGPDGLVRDRVRSPLRPIGDRCR